MPSWFAHWPKTKLFLFALLFRLLTALFFHQPGYTDAYYYSDMAQSLWQGRGFHEDFVWNYLSKPLPTSLYNNPGCVYWLPLTSILIYLAYLLGGGPSFLLSQIPNAILSAGLAPLAYALCEDFFGRDNPRRVRYGWLGGALTIFGGLYAAWFVLPDNFAPYAFFSCLFLICSYKALRRPPGQTRPVLLWMALAGVCAGLCYLARADGPLLLAAPPLAALLYRRFLRQPSGLGWAGLGVMCLTAGLTVTPWLLRNLADTGQLLPGGGLKTLFWREYNDFFTYVKPLDLPYYLNQTYPSPNWGLGPLLLSKAAALLDNLWLWGRSALFMLPFMLGGLWRRPIPGQLRTWQRPEFLPFVIYSLLLYLAMSLAFTFPGTRGSTFHSAGGLLPFIYLASWLGFEAAISWLSRRYRPKAEARRQRSYSLLVVLVFGLIALFRTVDMSRGWDNDFSDFQAIQVWLTTHDQSGNIVTMGPDPAAYMYTNHQPSLAVSSDSLAVNLELAHRYNVRYLIVHPLNHPDSLNEVYANKGGPGLELATIINGIQVYRLK